MVTIKIIIGSVRPNRFGPQVAHWLMELGAQYKKATFELIDLKEINLPFLDEPEMPTLGHYQNEHTKEWSAMIEPADGFVWVHPEYNHSVSPALKNALDYLWREWNDKPVALAGYGAEAGGARAAEQLRQVAGGLRMFDLRSQLGIANYRQYLDETGVFIPSEPHVKAAHNMLRDIVFWSEHMASARAAYKKLVV